MSENQLIEWMRDWMVEHQKSEREHQEAVNTRLANIEDTLAQAKGGWRVLVTIGTLVTVISGALAWLWVNVFQGKPPSH